MPSAGRDQVFVHGLEFEANHGYTAAERKLTRRFRCSIELERDLQAAAASDRLQDTVNYRDLCAVAVEIGTGRTFRLIEALAGAIADAVEARHPDAVVSVTVEKLAPPCPGAPASAGVRITRRPGT